MSHHPVIRATDLVFEYPDGTRALDGLSVEVHDGERVAVLGANGAGKTTFALHLNGLHRATSGEVAVDGMELSDATVGEIRRRVGHVFQDPDDQLFMPTVAEDVGFGPANLGVTGHDLEHRIADALGAVGMADAAGRAPHHLSGGERRLLEISRALVMEPEILLVDEPSIGLEPRFIDMVFDILDDLQRAEGKTIVMVEQNAKKGLEFADIGYVLVSGETALAGMGDELLQNPEVGRLFLGG